MIPVHRARILHSPRGHIGFILWIAPHCTLPIRALSPTSPTQESRKGRASVVRIAQRVRATPRAQSHKPGVYEDRALFPPDPQDTRKVPCSLIFNDIAYVRKRYRTSTVSYTPLKPPTNRNVQLSMNAVTQTHKTYKYYITQKYERR